MRTILLLLSITISSALFAQKSEILDKFKEYEFSVEFLNQGLKDANADHFFDAKITTVNGTETKIEEAKFDPKKKIGERWSLISVNGNVPTKKETKLFNKSYNTTEPDINGKVDENSWEIEKDDENYLVISFKYEKASLPKKYAFLGDCIGLAYFNKQTKKLEKAEFVNDKPLKIKILNVTKLDMVVLYSYDENEKIYLIQKEDLRMEVKLLGQIVNVNEITVFSNYKKK